MVQFIESTSLCFVHLWLEIQEEKSDETVREKCSSTLLVFVYLVSRRVGLGSPYTWQAVSRSCGNGAFSPVVHHPKCRALLAGLDKKLEKEGPMALVGRPGGNCAGIDAVIA